MSRTVIAILHPLLWLRSYFLNPLVLGRDNSVLGIIGKNFDKQFQSSLCPDMSCLTSDAGSSTEMKSCDSDCAVSGVHPEYLMTSTNKIYSQRTGWRRSKWKMVVIKWCFQMDLVCAIMDFSILKSVHKLSKKPKRFWLPRFILMLCHHHQLWYIIMNVWKKFYDRNSN